ncbi:hypothetical protein BGZ98_000529 [Dissophora globulifera]|nr:hypothetical protein BGZ98_000529 [Dissophora globulifera]
MECPHGVHGTRVCAECLRSGHPADRPFNRPVMGLAHDVMPDLTLGQGTQPSQPEHIVAHSNVNVLLSARAEEAAVRVLRHVSSRYDHYVSEPAPAPNFDFALSPATTSSFYSAERPVFHNPRGLLSLSPTSPDPPPNHQQVFRPLLTPVGATGTIYDSLSGMLDSTPDASFFAAGSGYLHGFPYPNQPEPVFTSPYPPSSALIFPNPVFLVHDDRPTTNDGLQALASPFVHERSVAGPSALGVAPIEELIARNQFSTSLLSEARVVGSSSADGAVNDTWNSLSHSEMTRPVPLSDADFCFSPETRPPEQTRPSVSEAARITGTQAAAARAAVGSIENVVSVGSAFSTSPWADVFMGYGNAASALALDPVLSMSASVPTSPASAFAKALDKFIATALPSARPSNSVEPISGLSMSQLRRQRSDPSVAQRASPTIDGMVNLGEGSVISPRRVRSMYEVSLTSTLASGSRSEMATESTASTSVSAQQARMSSPSVISIPLQPQPGVVARTSDNDKVMEIAELAANEHSKWQTMFISYQPENGVQGHSRGTSRGTGKATAKDKGSKGKADDATSRQSPNHQDCKLAEEQVQQHQQQHSSSSGGRNDGHVDEGHGDGEDDLDHSHFVQEEPLKPVNSFILFRKYQSIQRKASFSGMSGMEISQYLGLEWKGLSEETKLRWKTATDRLPRRDSDTSYSFRRSKRSDRNRINIKSAVRPGPVPRVLTWCNEDIDSFNGESTSGNRGKRPFEKISGTSNSSGRVDDVKATVTNKGMRGVGEWQATVKKKSVVDKLAKDTAKVEERNEDASNNTLSQEMKVQTIASFGGVPGERRDTAIAAAVQGQVPGYRSQFQQPYTYQQQWSQIRQEERQHLLWTRQQQLQLEQQLQQLQQLQCRLQYQQQPQQEQQQIQQQQQQHQHQQKHEPRSGSASNPNLYMSKRRKS